MGTALKIDENETTLLRAHYEGVVRDTLRIIWDRKLLVVAILVAALVLASIALVLVGPRYTGEAIILMIRRAGFLGFRSAELVSPDFPRRQADLLVMPTGKPTNGIVSRSLAIHDLVRAPSPD